MRYIGVHVSVAGGIHTAFDRAEILKINAMQVFLKSANRWHSPPYKDEEKKTFRTRLNNFNAQRVFSHNSYLVNLAGSGEILNKSIDSMLDEFKRAGLLGVENIVIHPGSHKGMGESPGILKIAQSLDIIFEKSENTGVSVLLENTSGQGSSIGYRMEHLRDIIGRSKYQDRLFVCLDTCHLFAAGYDFTSKAKARSFLEEFRQVVGIDKLKLIHLNDSKKALSSRVDRHEDIGRGEIGSSGLKPFLNDKMIENIPLILETPKMDEFKSDIKNLKIVYKLIGL